MKRIESLDGLRGIAVLCVVFFHYFPREGAGPLRPLISSGWVGVDLFFVLSGYLITTILYKQRGANGYLRNFYGRRILRLFPLYYALFLLALCLTGPLRIHWRPEHVVMAFHGANLVLPRDNSLGSLGPLTFFHLWSLSVEEQFYLIWPWLASGKQIAKRRAAANLRVRDDCGADDSHPSAALEGESLVDLRKPAYKNGRTDGRRFVSSSAAAIIKVGEGRRGCFANLLFLLAWRGHSFSLLPRLFKGWAILRWRYFLAPCS